jgi:hypothetical protein
MPMSFKLPIIVELKVTDAPPGIKGDTATGGNKVITLVNVRPVAAAAPAKKA